MAAMRRCFSCSFPRRGSARQSRSRAVRARSSCCACAMSSRTVPDDDVAARSSISSYKLPERMDALESHLDTSSDDFNANAQRLQGLVDELNDRLAVARQGGGE